MRHLLQPEIAGMGQQTGIELGQERGPEPISVGRMDKVPGKVGPGVDLHQELRELHARETLGDALRQGVRTRGSGVGLQGRQHQAVILDPQVTALARQEPLDLGHGAGQLDFAFVEAFDPLTGRAGLAHHLRPPVRPLLGRNEIGVRIGIAPTMGDPDIAGAEGTAEMPQACRAHSTAG